MRRLSIAVAVILALTLLTTVGCSWYQSKSGRDTLASESYWSGVEGDSHHFVVCGVRQPQEKRVDFQVRLQSEAIRKLHEAGKRLEKDEGVQFFLSSSGKNACVAVHELGTGHYMLEAFKPNQ